MGRCRNPSAEKDAHTLLDEVEQVDLGTATGQELRSLPTLLVNSMSLHQASESRDLYEGLRAEYERVFARLADREEPAKKVEERIEAELAVVNERLLELEKTHKSFISVRMAATVGFGVVLIGWVLLGSDSQPFQTEALILGLAVGLGILWWFIWWR